MSESGVKLIINEVAYHDLIELAKACNEFNRKTKLEKGILIGSQFPLAPSKKIVLMLSAGGDYPKDVLAYVGIKATKYAKQKFFEILGVKKTNFFVKNPVILTDITFFMDINSISPSFPNNQELILSFLKKKKIKDFGGSANWSRFLISFHNDHYFEGNNTLFNLIGERFNLYPREK